MACPRKHSLRVEEPTLLQGCSSTLGHLPQQPSSFRILLLLLGTLISLHASEGYKGLGSWTSPACPFSLPRAPNPALVMASHSWAHISFSSPVLHPYSGSSSTFLSSRAPPSLFSGFCPEGANWVQEHPGLGPFMVFLIYQTEHNWYMVSDFKKLSHLIMISLLY